MPETIVSQYERAYNSPIETRRQVATATDRDNIPSGVRWRGMLVHVVADNATYELVGGIGNGDWQLMGGLQDAPIDGKIYGRKDGNWELIPSGGGIVVFKDLTEVNYNGTTESTEMALNIAPSDVQIGDIFKFVLAGQLTRNTGTITVGYTLLGAARSLVWAGGGTGTAAFTIQGQLYIESLSEGYISSVSTLTNNVSGPTVNVSKSTTNYESAQITQVGINAGNATNNIKLVSHIVERIR